MTQLLFFTAPWCSACRALYPILNTLDRTDVRWELVRINIDETPALATQYLIRSLPTLILVDEAEGVLAQHTGMTNRMALIDWINEHLPTPTET